MPGGTSHRTGLVGLRSGSSGHWRSGNSSAMHTTKALTYSGTWRLARRWRIHKVVFMGVSPSKGCPGSRRPIVANLCERRGTEALKRQPPACQDPCLDHQPVSQPGQEPRSRCRYPLWRMSQAAHESLLVSSRCRLPDRSTMTPIEDGACANYGPGVGQRWA